MEQPELLHSAIPRWVRSNCALPSSESLTAQHQNFGDKEWKHDSGRHRSRRGQELDIAQEPLGRVPDCPRFHEMRTGAGNDEDAKGDKDP
jgi:hypothetical protein